MWKNTNQSIFQPFYKSNLTARVICKTKYLIHNDRFEVIDLISSRRITNNTFMFKAIHINSLHCDLQLHFTRHSSNRTHENKFKQRCA